ncbi:MAG TPA: hypothetical protein VIW78_06945 [Burkholderiales bacterium]
MSTFLTDRPPRAADTPRANAAGAARGSGDLFAGKPVARFREAAKRRLAIRRRLAPELAAARALCRQLRRKRVSAEKKRLVHLICLNLLAILKRRSQQA